MSDYVTLVRRQELIGMFRYEIADSASRRHTVEIPTQILRVDPRNHNRGTDQDHLDIIACGTVLASLDQNETFHTVDRSMVNRAYEAASHAQLLGRH